jgi:lipopolysaccharide transport system ATP-binding protein
MEMSSVRFANVSKRFILRHERPHSFQEMVLRLFDPRRRGSSEELWALQGVSFTVEPGETVGLIGPNGAGKSTALKLIARILEPTAGFIETKGKVFALLELGAGFHPDLTGEENIYLNGSVLGLGRKEITRKLDQIVAFAGLGDFIDTPVKHFSAGMYVRLGFAIAVHLEPEILLIDEVLAVGDMTFQIKCWDKITELQQEGITIVLVSHDLDAVQKLCSRVIWLDHGQVRAQGAANEITTQYRNAVLASLEGGRSKFRRGIAEGRRWGTGEAEILGVEFLDEKGDPRWTIRTGEAMVARIRYRASKKLDRPTFGVAIYRSDGVHINGPNTRLSGYDIDHIEGEGFIDYRVDALPLLPGIYQFSAAIYDYESIHPYDHHHRLYTFVVQPGGTTEHEGLFQIPCRWEHADDRK